MGYWFDTPVGVREFDSYRAAWEAACVWGNPRIWFTDANGSDWAVTHFEGQEAFGLGSTAA